MKSTTVTPNKPKNGHKCKDKHVAPNPNNAMNTYVVEVSTELIGDDSTDIRQNLGLVLYQEYVTNSK